MAFDFNTSQHSLSVVSGKKVLLGVGASLVLTGLLLSGCGPRSPQVGGSLNMVSASANSELPITKPGYQIPLFETHCSRCHGAQAMRPMDTLLPYSREIRSKEAFLQLMENPPGGMPRFSNQLTPEEIDTLYQALHRAVPKS